MEAKIVDIEYYLPGSVLSNIDLQKEFPDWDNESFEKKVGIRQRHIAGENETALDLAYQAAEKVLAGKDKDSIDYILFCTQSPDYFLPTGACILQDRLGLRKNIGALDFNLGCSGFVYGLSLAKGLVKGEVAKKVLLITAETYSKHIHPKDKTNRSIFGDGAAATIIAASEITQIGQFNLGTDGSGADKLIVKNGGFRCSYDKNATLKSYGDNNLYSDNELYMNGPDIFNFTIDTIPNVVNETLAINQFKIDEIDYFVFHQANAFMLNFLRKKLKIKKDKFHIELKDTGNTVSATIPIALHQAIKNKKVKRGDNIMLVGFGVGLSWGATIIKL